MTYIGFDHHRNGRTLRLLTIREKSSPRVLNDSNFLKGFLKGTAGTV